MANIKYRYLKGENKMTENESYEEQDIETLLEEKLEEAEIKPAKKLDYTLQTAQERSDFVSGVLQETNPEKIVTQSPKQ